MAYTHPRALLEALGLDPALRPAAEAAARQFALLVPRGYAALIRRGDPHDPLLHQVLPLGLELAEAPGYSIDPVRDAGARRAPGLLQKYAGRGLLVVTGACAIHCRYCFRRHFPYAEGALIHDRERTALKAVAGDPGISEVILSGGDPLMLDDGPLADLVHALEAIPYLRRLRLHTRLPVVLPSRVTSALCALLADSRLDVAVVVHANHARELGAETRAALVDLRAAGATLLNQSVLLRGVNDSVEALAGLSEALFADGVLPYYLNLLDRVAGAAHFEVSAARGMRLMEALRAQLPGYLVPRLVREIPGALSKSPVC
jgi:EF-P beta-lysylation protein EpmB